MEHNSFKIKTNKMCFSSPLNELPAKIVKACIKASMS